MGAAGAEIGTLALRRHVDLHAIDRDQMQHLGSIEERAQLHIEPELLHREHRRQIATASVSQLNAVAFDGGDQAVPAVEQRLDEGCSPHPHAERRNFNLAVEAVMQVGNDLFADEGLDSTSEDVTGDGYCDE